MRRSPWTIDGLAAGSLKGVPQVGSADLKHAPKIFTETCRIDWNKPVASVYNLIRGLSPFPAAFTELDGKVLKVYQAEKELRPTATAGSATGSAAPPGTVTGSAASPGTYETDGKTYLRFAATDGYIRVLELQLEGKKKMMVGDFLRGYRFPSNS